MQFLVYSLITLVINGTLPPITTGPSPTPGPSLPPLVSHIVVIGAPAVTVNSIYVAGIGILSSSPTAFLSSFFLVLFLTIGINFYSS
jgi:hypothetical protein